MWLFLIPLAIAVQIGFGFYCTIRYLNDIEKQNKDILEQITKINQQLRAASHSGHW